MELTGFRRAVAATAGVAVFLCAWSVGAIAIDNRSLLPSPLSVATRLVLDLQQPLLWRAIYHTFAEALMGCFFGSIAALPLAYLMYRNRYLAAAFSPIVAISQSIPSVAVAPLLVIWVGYGLVAISVLCAIIVFFPILVTTVLGLKSLPTEVLEAARLDGASGWTMLAWVETPLALPAVLAGLRTGFTLSVIGAVVGEFVMGGQGLGARLSLQASVADLPGLFSTVTVLCALAAFAFGLIAAMERHRGIDAT